METQTGVSGVENNGAVEKHKLLTQLEAEIQANPNFSYAATGHFIVVYNSPGIYRYFGSWLDTDPNSLAEFLERGLTQAVNHFQIDNPDTIQYVDVKSGVLGMGGGLHLGTSRGYVPLKEWHHARFSKVFSGKLDQPTPNNKPGIYGWAVHEAIGHGIIARILTGIPINRLELLSRLIRRPHSINFLEEGLANYVENLVMGIDPHDEMRAYLISAALDRFMSGDGNWELNKRSQSDIEKVVRKKSTWADFAISDFFKLRKNNSKQPLPDDFHSNPDYYRGSSFIGYLINQYGVEAFKSWIKTVNRTNFFDSLTKITGKTIEEIEQEWKREVLSGSFKTDPRWKGIQAPRRYLKLHNADDDTRNRITDDIKTLYQIYA